MFKYNNIDVTRYYLDKYLVTSYKVAENNIIAYHPTKGMREMTLNDFSYFNGDVTCSFAGQGGIIGTYNNSNAQLECISKFLSNHIYSSFAWVDKINNGHVRIEVGFTTKSNLTTSITASDKLIYFNSIITNSYANLYIGKNNTQLHSSTVNYGTMPQYSKIGLWLNVSQYYNTQTHKMQIKFEVLYDGYESGVKVSSKPIYTYIMDDDNSEIFSNIIPYAIFKSDNDYADGNITFSLGVNYAYPALVNTSSSGGNNPVINF